MADETQARQELRLRVLRALDKADRMSPADVYALLTTGRMDASGDFTTGCGLSESSAAFLTRMTFFGR